MICHETITITMVYTECDLASNRQGHISGRVCHFFVYLAGDSIARFVSGNDAFVLLPAGARKSSLLP